MAVKIISVVGARPNFMKIAAICDAVDSFNNAAGEQVIQHLLVHTGQHYDANMSDSFFSDLGLPKPDISLGVGSGSHSVQTARVMERFENVVLSEQPQVVLVVGDVNSTVACALVTKKTVCQAEDGTEFIPRLAHVEAGLRSFDRSMPEEINRIVTDSVSDYLFTTEESANRNLSREGILESKVFFVGNVMIDTLLRHRTKADESMILQELGLVERDQIKPYAILTLHRPANVDDKTILRGMLEAFLEVSKKMVVIFPAHPRTVKRIRDNELGHYFVDHLASPTELANSIGRIRLVPPLGYLAFLKLMSEAQVVMSDSGGVQEETTILGVPCVTLRDNTERPVTIDQGTNVLVGTNPTKIKTALTQAIDRERNSGRTPQFWDGSAAKRIVKILHADYCPLGDGMASEWNLQVDPGRKLKNHRI